LIARGVKPGDVFVVALPSSIDFAIAYAGGMYAGAIVSGVNPRLGVTELDGIVARCTPRGIVFAADSPAFADIAVRLTREHLRGLLLSDWRLQHAVLRKSSDPAVIIWTSGTTGMPKGVWFSHAALAAGAETAGVLAAPFDRRLASAPFAHASYMTKVWEQIAYGVARIVTPTPWRATDMLRIILDEKITMAGAVPTQWERFVELPGVAEADFSFLRVASTSSAPATPQLVEAVTRTLGCPLVVRFASSEAPSMTGTSPSDKPDILFHTVGHAQRGVELRVVDASGNPVAIGKVGRVELRSAHMMGGYWNDAAATKAVLADDGWMSTSDLGCLDADGNLTLTGRTTEMYIRGGYNVYPIEVEAVLADHPAVARVAVVGIPAPVVGDIGAAFIVPADPDHPPSFEELQQWCKTRLAIYKTPERLFVLDTLPLTSMLKIDKAALKKLAHEDDREADHSAVEATVK
jgi:acyl-CoA synthetase (AMP-forming)/AMP-acid ligase II